MHNEYYVSINLTESLFFFPMTAPLDKTPIIDVQDVRRSTITKPPIVHEYIVPEYTRRTLSPIFILSPFLFTLSLFLTLPFSPHYPNIFHPDSVSIFLHNSSFVFSSNHAAMP